MTGPRDALDAAGATTPRVAADGYVQGMHHGEKLDAFPVDMPLDKAADEEFDALLLPGGVANPDALRLEPKVIDFVASFQNKPIAAICHGPWTLIDADRGTLRLTNFVTPRIPSTYLFVANNGDKISRDCQVALLIPLSIFDVPHGGEKRSLAGTEYGMLIGHAVQPIYPNNIAVRAELPSVLLKHFGEAILLYFIVDDYGRYPELDEPSSRAAYGELTLAESERRSVTLS